MTTAHAVAAPPLPKTTHEHTLRVSVHSVQVQQLVRDKGKAGEHGAVPQVAETRAAPPGTASEHSAAGQVRGRTSEGSAVVQPASVHCTRKQQSSRQAFRATWADRRISMHTCDGGPGVLRRGKKPTMSCWLACHLANARSTSAHLQRTAWGKEAMGTKCSQSRVGSSGWEAQGCLACR